MIEKFITTLKDKSVFIATQKTKTEMAFVGDSLRNLGFNVATDYTKQLMLTKDGIELRNYYEDLVWLCSVLNEMPIVCIDKIEFHDNLRVILSKEGLI